MSDQVKVLVPWLSELKLGREMEAHLGRITAYIWTGYPKPMSQGPLKLGSGVHAAQSLCFRENFIKQKLQKTPSGHVLRQIWI